MGIKKNVFGSKSEQRNFYKLSRTWGEKYRIYHNLPFLNIFNTQGLYDFSDFTNIHPISISEIDLSRLKKTSVDFTLCDENDTPILCIEFDGLQEGFNVGDTYYPTDISNPPNEWRRIITELKLKVALGSAFPFVVVASKHFNDLSSSVKLTIVDGIIGEVLTTRNTSEIINKGFHPQDVGYSDEEFSNLSSEEQHDIIQDWVLAIEVESEFEHNPIVRKRAEMERELDIHGYSIEYFCYPSLDTAETLQERAKLMNGAIYNGAKIKLKTNDLGEVEGIAYIPNFKSIASTGELAENIAAIFAMERIKNMRARASQKAKGF